MEQREKTRIPMRIEHMISSAADEGLRDKAVQFYEDPARGARYDAMMSEFLADLPDYAVNGLADACYSYIRAWDSGGGNREIAQCVKDNCTTDYPRVLAISLYRAPCARDTDKTEAYCLITCIFEDAMLTLTTAA